MQPSEDVRFEALSSHYDKTFQLTTNALGRRDRSFLMLIVILAPFWLQVWTPSELYSATEAFWRAQLGVVASINFQLLDSLLWKMRYHRTFRGSLLPEKGASTCKIIQFTGIGSLSYTRCFFQPLLW